MSKKCRNTKKKLSQRFAKQVWAEKYKRWDTLEKVMSTKKMTFRDKFDIYDIVEDVINKLWFNNFITDKKPSIETLKEVYFRNGKENL